MNNIESNYRAVVYLAACLYYHWLSTGSILFIVSSQQAGVDLGLSLSVLAACRKHPPGGKGQQLDVNLLPLYTHTDCPPEAVFWWQWPEGGGGSVGSLCSCWLPAGCSLLVAWTSGVCLCICFLKLVWSSCVVYLASNLFLIYFSIFSLTSLKLVSLMVKLLYWRLIDCIDFSDFI